MNPELDAALEVFENMLSTLERNFEEDKSNISDIDITHFTQAWRKEMTKQVALENIKSKF